MPVTWPCRSQSHRSQILAVSVLKGAGLEAGRGQEVRDGLTLEGFLELVPFC